MDDLYQNNGLYQNSFDPYLPGGRQNLTYNPDGSLLSWEDRMYRQDMNSLWDRYFGDNSLDNSFSLGDLAAMGKMLTGGLNAVSGIGNMINSINALNLARDQFDYQKGLANTNLANQAKIINNTYDNAAKVSAALMGSSTDSGLANEYAQRARSRYVRDHI